MHQTDDRTERLEIYERLGIQYARKHSFITDAAIAQAKDTVKREQIEAKARAAIEEPPTVEASLKKPKLDKLKPLLFDGMDINDAYLTFKENNIPNSCRYDLLLDNLGFWISSNSDYNGR